MVFLVLVFNCQKEDVILADGTGGHGNAQVSSMKITPITGTDIQDNTVLKDKLSAIQNKGKHKGNMSSKDVYNDTYDFIIHTNQGNYIEDGAYHSYTFPITRTEDNGLLENIMLSLQEDGSYKAFLFAYDITDTQISQIENHEKLDEDITVVSVEELDGDFSVVINDVQANKVIYQDDCVSVIEHEWHTNPDNGNEDLLEYQGQCEHDGSDGGPTCSIRYTYETINICVGGSSDPNDNENSIYDPTPPTGGSGTNNGDSTVITTRCKINCIVTIEQGVIIEGLNIPTDVRNPEYTWIVNDALPWQIAILSAYISANALNPEAMQFAHQAFNAYMHGGEVDWDDIIYVLENEQDYRNQMSEDELSLFDTLSNEEQVLYLVSAKQAIDATNELFLTPCEKYNGKGDAFRHAYWNALSSQRIGVGLTNLLTTRHENRPPLYPYSSKETEMDLFNNQVGRDIVSNGMTSLLLMQQAIQDTFDNGDLRYLNNQDSNCLATFSSQLIPTNQ